MLIVLLIALNGCEDKMKYDFPDFESNDNIRNLTHGMKDIIQESDFSIVEVQSNDFLQYGLADRTLLHDKYNNWIMSERRYGIEEADSSKALNRYEGVTKNIVITKYISNKMAQEYISTFNSLGLFELEEESELRVHCKDEYMRKEEFGADMTTLTFYIIKGSQVRRLTYYSPWVRNERCPEISQWKQVIKIDSIFRNNWFLDRHY
jgi:hypothetical protein